MNDMPGDLMTYEQFLEAAAIVAFTDDDGWGEWAFYDYSDGMIRLRISDIQIFPSDVSLAEFEAPMGYTHIMWYNK